MMMDPPAHSVNVGIMADSHGDADAIRTAIRQFRRLGCRQIYHLGDICDSAHPETADACLWLLRSAAVIAIRGNNDHSIVANCRRRPDAPVSPENLQYLEALPLKREGDGAVFVHSLPFTETLGPASMIGDLAPGEIGEAISRGGWEILFRGHSHDPQIMWIGAGKTRVRPLLPGERLVLAARLPCVVTCGALSSGYSMIWIPSQHAVACQILA